MMDIGSIYNNSLHCHVNTTHSTLGSGSKLILSSGENNNPKTKLTKNVVHTHTHILETEFAREKKKYTEKYKLQISKTPQKEILNNEDKT
jgi:hypothetical protein